VTQPPDPTALDPAERKGRLEIRLIMALVAAVLVLGAIWVAVYGSPSADRRAIDSSDIGPPRPAATQPAAEPAR
jgi:hypothetical protein